MTGLLTFAAALFAMMNPIGNAGIFASMTGDSPSADQRRIAWTAAFAAMIIALITLWAGPAILSFFGISIAALRSAGGVVVLLIGLAMLRGDNTHRKAQPETEHADQTDNPAVVPIAIPLLAGPGTMATILANAHAATGLSEKLGFSAVILGMWKLTGALFTLAGPIARRLGPAGVNVMTRVMGLLLAAIAMGMLAEGLTGLFPVLSPKT